MCCSIAFAAYWLETTEKTHSDNRNIDIAIMRTSRGHIAARSEGLPKSCCRVSRGVQLLHTEAEGW
eukprot:3951927-Amphidinium_carterae.1